MLHRTELENFYERMAKQQEREGGTIGTDVESRGICQACLGDFLYDLFLARPPQPDDEIRDPVRDTLAVAFMMGLHYGE